MTDVLFDRLAPVSSPARTTAAEFVADCGWRARAPRGRAYVIANFVATADGAASFGGRSAPLSDPADRALFHALRAGSDAIMAGTGTLAIERYRPAVKPVVTVTRSGELPLAIPLFAEPDGRAIVFTGREPALDGAAADITVEPLEDLGAAMESLRRRHGIEVLLCEGGPMLFGALVRAGLVDELFLTLSPRLAGGADGPAVAAGMPLEQMQPLELASVLNHESTLFLRYRRARDTA